MVIYKIKPIALGVGLEIRLWLALNLTLTQTHNFYGGLQDITHSVRGRFTLWLTLNLTLTQTLSLTLTLYYP